MKKFIIGFAGEKGVGKDTLASMVSYIMTVGINKANFADYLRYNVNRNYPTIIHFADKLKDCVSIIYNIPREYMDNREYKDEMLYCLEEHRFLTQKDAAIGYDEICIEDLYDEKLCDIASQCNGKACVKLRTLLQYFGTDMCREMLGYDIWVTSTMYNAADIVDKYGFCCIADVRFRNEANAITSSSLYGRLVRIKRDVHGEHNHASEIIEFDCPEIIDNNSSKLNLFYKAIEIVQNLIHE